jgi:hypothetical protein
VALIKARAEELLQECCPPGGAVLLLLLLAREPYPLYRALDLGGFLFDV